MHTTKPSAKRQPYSAQYALSESSIVPSVPILVSPSSSGFQSASRKNHSALSFSAANAKADIAAAPQRLMPLGLSALSAFFSAGAGAPAVGGAPSSSFFRKPRIAPVMWLYCFDSGGSSTSALRQVARQSAISPRALACSAARASSSSGAR